MSFPRDGSLRSQLHLIADRAADYLESLPSRPVARDVPHADLLRAVDRSLPEEGRDAGTVLRELAENVDPGLVASGGPRYFGFVVGGATPVSLMADWLTSAWDQNAQVYATSPAASITETVAARWLLELLGLPMSASVGFVTGGQMASFTALACARATVLSRVGWDVDTHGLFGAPTITVLMSDQGHATIRSALRMLGMGNAQIRAVESDGEGRMQMSALAEQLRRTKGQPMIVSLQAGNVNTGAFEPIDAVADLVSGENAWIHVDGAFGLWAATSPALVGALRGIERADSWSTDGHKWLNVPYDSGFVVIKDPEAHRRLKTARCAYAGTEAVDRRDGSTWVPENSRRARGFVIYAALRSLGRRGVREIVEGACARARELAEGVARLQGAHVLNQVVLNQVLVRFDPPHGVDPAPFHHAIAAHVQADGRCWLGATAWKGDAALRASFSSASTTSADVAVALDALQTAVEAATLAYRSRSDR